MAGPSAVKPSSIELTSVSGTGWHRDWGDSELVNGDERREGCRRAVDLIVAAGGRAELMLLPALGVAGNSHYLMMDDNNLIVAEMLLPWIDASLPSTDT